MSLMRLGPFKFEARGPSVGTLSRESAARIAKLEPTGAPLIAQFGGPGEDRMDLEGVIYPGMGAGFAQIDAMREAMNRGTSMMLVTGYGQVIGKFAIERLNAEDSFMMGDGAPQKRVFSMSLTRV